MVRSGQSAEPRRILFDPTARSRSGVEVTDFARVRTMPAGGRAPTTQRADFHVLAIVSSGHGSLMVDFAQHDLCTGTIVWIDPGRVHRWDDIGDIDGSLVLFRSETIPRPVISVRATAWNTSSHSGLVQLAVDHLLAEYDAALADANILRGLLDVLLRRVTAWVQTESPVDATFGAYAGSVETNFAASREVAWYADRLGYSARTLSRATQRTVGRTAKEFVDDRVVLEAKRLLGHHRLGAAECARHVGFDDPSNFSKFFRTRTGVTPSEFAATTIPDR